ncbi:tissue factor pathway inhibitor isoform X1 [Meles meles]|uniref:tissue factor pathway inhibitor isoform X1 n=1 Tax=Meles meles TaxID=9662 RepID=UPI001E69DE76|nr:tissue factor pathway inhibitor isoform X1 [Meles meles]XP_045875040.1 tissue factor pathway inhibitor isoform X1 [Meles meles]XP_045875041.1 tissue factor pathway inhibitor isoform X1 [Meles meles]XP_045875042.1 tissue factor pathway inhibitor isoform X1 [Meles meles]
MIFTMKKEQIFWVSVYLLLDCASAPLSAVLETEDYADITDVELPPLKLLHSFCALKPDNGPCRAMITQFFFNIHTQQCEEFMYGGCEGNQNRFATLEACQEKCTDVYPKTRTQTKLEKEKPDYCFLDEDSGLCRGYLTRYFYNNETKKCEEFKYGGCLGNQNNFMSLEQCKSTCEDLAHDQLDEAVHNTIISDSTDNTLPISSGGSMTPLDLTNNVTPADSVNSESAAPPPTEAPSFLEFHGPSWCLTPADRGLCHANESRFYYNSVTGKCRPFKYSGCGGNENNFTSKKACLRACKKGFIQRISKGGLIKTKRKRKKQRVKIVYEKIFVKKT